MSPSIDPTLDRMFRHMAWANNALLGKLIDLPSGSMDLAAPGSEWTVAAILEHYVRSAGFYAFRLGAQIPEFTLGKPSEASDLVSYRAICEIYDGLLRTQGSKSDGMTTFLREGRNITRARSTILGQSIHHATEHRAQIGDILVIHGINEVDLDDLDVWALGDAEGLGE
ncbi:MAG: hypothetical protein NTX12_05355 [Actinobacteria bacterium]|nr:hypothetical protein [Actinomycetota bacterium]